MVPRPVIVHLMQACKSNSFKHLQEAAAEIIAQGYPLDQVLLQLQPQLVADESISDLAKGQISIRMAEIDKCLLDGADEHLQLLDLMSYIAKQIGP